jgi:TolB-like protein
MASVWGELKRRNVVRVAIAYAIVSWLLLQVADVVLDNIEAPTWVFQAILLLLVIGFPIAIIFAWAFELTPEGIKKEKDVDRSQSVTHITGRKLDFAIIGVLAMAIVYFVANEFLWNDKPAIIPRVNASVAVLPFVPLSSGEDDGYFADGLTEEILNALTQLPELQISARTASFFFKGQDVPVPEIANRLDVAHIVEGSVRRDGQRVRITAQLIRASDGFHLWSQNYDRTLDDVFAVQEDIAENIAEVLGVVLDDDARQVMRSAGIGDVEAFIAYQKGLEAYNSAHGAGSISELLFIANAYFDQALEAAPGLTAAHLMKVDLASHIIHEIAIGMHDEEYPGQARETHASLLAEYDLALQLSPPGNRRDILNLERTFFTGDWSGLPAQIEKAMQPGACPQMNWTNVFLAPYGWGRRTAVKLREILECDPMDISASYHLAYSYLLVGDAETVLSLIEDTEKRGISHPYLEDARYWALLAAGRADDAMARGPGPKGSMMAYPRQILREALVGDPDIARRMAEDYWSDPDADDQSSLVIAAVMGDRKRANEIAARLDTHLGSPIAFSLIAFTCFCGAPFDLEAAPNYKARLEEAGFTWPPQKIIEYPTKTW